MSVLKKPAKKPSPKSEEPFRNEVVPLSRLVFDSDYQMREELPSISDYVAILEDQETDAWPFESPITVCEVGKKYVVVDGFTRGNACKKHGRETVNVRVKKATKNEAFKMALSSNSTHGIARTRADKRKAIIKAVGKWPSYSARSIAVICDVSRPLVASVLNELKGVDESDPKEYEEAPAVVSKKGVCPNCELDDWKETGSGWECRSCQHPHGEPAGDKDEDIEGDVPAAESSAAEAPVSTPAPESVPDVDAIVDPWEAAIDDGDGAKPEGKPAAKSAVSPHPQALDLRGELIKRANTELGRLIRSVSELELYKSLEAPLEAITKALAKAK